jgi:4-amino-4-deoxy-L-arabinose transferase-like glycosyltransferase
VNTIAFLLANNASGDDRLKEYSKTKDAFILLGSCLVGTVATVFLVDFAELLGFRISLSWFLLLGASAFTSTLLLPEYWPELRSRIGYVARKHPLYVLLLVAAPSRLIFGLSMDLFPDEYTVLDLLRRTPVTDLGDFLYQYTHYAGTLSGHPPLSFLIMLAGYVIYPNPMSVRLVSIAFSLASVFIVYKIVIELGKEKEALLAAIFYAILPHTLMFMDLALTDVYMNFFGLLGFWFILKSLRNRDIRLAILSGAAVGLSLWSKSGIPLLWIAILPIVAIAFRGQIQTLRVRLQYLTIVLAVAGAVFGLWWLINPLAFYRGTYAVFVLVIITLNPSAYRFFSKNIPSTTELITVTQQITRTITETISGTTYIVSTIVTSISRVTSTACAIPGSATDNFSQFMTEFFPRLCRGGQSYISYPELLVQIPFWITPLILLFSLFGISRMSARNRSDVVMVAWVVLPLFAMMPWFRDIRYLVIFAPAVAYFAAIGIGFYRRDLRRRLIGLALAFALIFNGVAFVVGQQQYYGPPQAVQELQDLGLQNGPILTNWVALKFELPAIKVYTTNQTTSPEEVRNLTFAADVRAVVLFYNARGSPTPPSSELRSTVQELFSSYYKEEPSQFAWFEIFYNPRTDMRQAQSHDTPAFILETDGFVTKCWTP